MLDGDGPIFKINSIYCLKSILSYLEYNTVLKLVKYNKSFQKKIDINIKDYSLDYDLKKRTIRIKNDSFKGNIIFISFFIFDACLVLFLHVHQMFYALYYIYEKPYEYKEEKKNIEKYFQEYFGKSIIYHKIRILEICLLSFHILFTLAFCIISMAFGAKGISLLFFFDILLFQSIFFGIAFWLLWEAYFIYENQKSNSVILNLLIMIIFIFLNFFLLLAILIAYYFPCYYIRKEVYLEKFQGIKINSLYINDNFFKMKLEEKKRYILNKAKEMTFMNFQNEKNIKIIQSSINDYRKENKLDDLKYVDGLPEFVIYGNSLVKFTLDNILKIGDKKFLFKYPSGEFLKQLNEKNKNILNILSIDYLKEMKIVTKENEEYILVYAHIKENISGENIQIHYDTFISEKGELNTNLQLI